MNTIPGEAVHRLRVRTLVHKSWNPKSADWMLLEHRPCNSNSDYPDEKDDQPGVLRAAVAQEDEFIAFLQEHEIDDDPQFVLD